MAINQSSSTPPPTKKTPNKIATTTTNNARTDREEAINGVWTVGAMLTTSFGWLADAAAISIHGPNISRETAKLADRYQKLGTGIDKLAAVSPFAAVMAATVPLLCQLAVNHKMIPATAVAGMGVKDPEILESQMRVEAQRQMYEYQKAAAQEKADLDAELAKMTNVSTE